MTSVCLVALQSGDSTAYWGVQSLETAAVAAQWIADQTGCVNDETFLDCLRDIPALLLQNVSSKTFSFARYRTHKQTCHLVFFLKIMSECLPKSSPCLSQVTEQNFEVITLYNMYAPVVDGVTIPDSPLRMMQSGQVLQRDVLLGQFPLSVHTQETHSTTSSNCCKWAQSSE